MWNKCYRMDELAEERNTADHVRPNDEIIDINEIQVEEIAPEESIGRSLDTQAGKIGWALLWLLGVPLPILIIAYLIWGR